MCRAASRRSSARLDLDLPILLLETTVVALDAHLRNEETRCTSGFRGTGATGLEPATSGVTGHFHDRDVDDG